MGLHIVDARRVARLDGDATAEYRGPHGPLSGVRRGLDTIIDTDGGQVRVRWGRRSAADPAAVAALRRGIPIEGTSAVVARPGGGPTRADRQVHVTDGGQRWTWHERGRFFWARTRFERGDGSVVAEIRFGNRLAVDGAARRDEVHLAVICWIAWLDTLAQPVDLVAPV